MAASTFFRRAGVLLLNVGTPSAPETGPVRRYLRQFLSDPRVLDIHPLARFLLLNVAILPFRSKRSAAAYRKIWLPEGSPLWVQSQALMRALGEALGPEVPIAFGMQYGEPSIEDALDRLWAFGVERLVAVPLYPQHSSASTGSSLERVYRVAAARWNVPAVQGVPPFYDQPAYLDSFVEVAHPVLDGFRPDHVLFSFHGLPERHLHKSDPTGDHCLRSEGCCANLTPANRFCYRAQCFATARSLAAGLGIEASRHTVSFQSRLGRAPWIKPYTDRVLPELAAKGVKRVAVLCPAFVADCLETLEEIGIRARDDFRRAGGEDLVLVPSLNAHPRWVAGLAGLVRAQLDAVGRAGEAPAERQAAAGA